jgi:hypothetical protein
MIGGIRIRLLSWPNGRIQEAAALSGSTPPSKRFYGA